MSFFYSILQDILFAIWFFLPAGIANSTPIFANHIPIIKKWSYPLDFYLYFRGRRIFGDHKTLRGFISGIIASIGVAFFQQWPNPLLFGLLCGAGALTGDAIKSFFKRQLGIPSGKMWFPFDQLDYIFGGIIFTWFVFPLPLEKYVAITIVWFLLHIAASRIGHLLRLKTVPY